MMGNKEDTEVDCDNLDLSVLGNIQKLLAMCGIIDNHQKGSKIAEIAQNKPRFDRNEEEKLIHKICKLYCLIGRFIYRFPVKIDEKSDGSFVYVIFN